MIEDVRPGRDGLRRRVARAGTELLETRVGGEVFALDKERGRYLSFNPTATFIWDALDEPRTGEELVALARDAYPGAPASLEDDVLELVEWLIADGIVVPVR